MDTQAWIHRLPKAEQHLHIEGTIPWATVCEMTTEPLPANPEWLHPDYRFTDFADFESAVRLGLQTRKSLDDFHQAARYYFATLVEQNVRYVETTFALTARRYFGCAETIDAIVSAAPPGLTVKVFAAFARVGKFNDAMVQDVLNTPTLAGIDVHGDERTGNIDQFIDIFAEARRRGLVTKAHAGELCGSESIIEVLDKLQPQRIQHGITAARDNDEMLLRRLAEENVILDLCPTSNIKLRVIENMASYPIKRLLDAGVRVTLNTDDPGIFNCSLTSELLSLVEHNVLTLREIAEIQRTSFRAADLPDAECEIIEREIDMMIGEIESDFI